MTKGLYLYIRVYNVLWCVVCMCVSSVSSVLVRVYKIMEVLSPLASRSLAYLLTILIYYYYDTVSYFNRLD